MTVSRHTPHAEDAWTLEELCVRLKVADAINLAR